MGGLRNCSMQLIQIDSMINLEHVFAAIKSYQLTWNLCERHDIGQQLMISEQKVGTDVDDHLWVVLHVFTVEEAFKYDKVSLISVVW